MANNSIQKLVTEALPLNGDGRQIDFSQLAANLLPGTTDSLSEALSQTSRQVEGLRLISESQAEVLGANTQAILQNTVAQATGGGSSVGGTIGKIASSVLGSGFGLAPVVTSLVKLFGGGKSEPPAPLVRYTPPPSVHLEAANITSLGAIQPADYGQRGLPRALPTISNSQSTSPAEILPPRSSETNTPITIQVNAMDSRSFLDHSEDIARAVREAMLNMHALNDVVSDL